MSLYDPNRIYSIHENIMNILRTQNIFQTRKKFIIIKAYSLENDLTVPF